LYPRALIKLVEPSRTLAISLATVEANVAGPGFRADTVSAFDIRPANSIHLRGERKEVVAAGPGLDDRPVEEPHFAKTDSNHGRELIIGSGDPRYRNVDS
jgi:hypothetical protein